MLDFYATTRSERAEKGQGGQEYLEIEVNYRFQPLMRILAKPDDTGGVEVFTSPGEGPAERWTSFAKYSAKELPPRGGIGICGTCGNPTPHYAIINRKRVYYCDNCER